MGLIESLRAFPSSMSREPVLVLPRYGALIDRFEWRRKTSSRTNISRLLAAFEKSGTGNDKCVWDDTVVREAVGGGSIEKGVMAMDVLVRIGMKNRDFCLVLTKDGIILVREKSRDEIHPGAFGYASVHIREHDHPSAESIDGAALGEKNLVIPYDRLRKLHFRRGFAGCTMRREYIILLDYLDASQKERKLSAVLMPPPQPSGRISWNRLKRTAVIEHAMEVKKILAEALPVSGVFVSDV